MSPGGPNRRRTESLENIYKRVRHVFRYDSAITLKAMKTRFGICHNKLRALKQEVLQDANKET